MKWWTKFKKSWDHEWEVYYRGVDAGKRFMAGETIAIPDDIKDSDYYTQVYGSGVATAINSYKALKRIDDKYQDRAARSYMSHPND